MPNNSAPIKVQDVELEIDILESSLTVVVDYTVNEPLNDDDNHIAISTVVVEGNETPEWFVSILQNSDDVMQLVQEDWSQNSLNPHRENRDDEAKDEEADKESAEEDADSKAAAEGDLEDQGD